MAILEPVYRVTEPGYLEEDLTRKEDHILWRLRDLLNLFALNVLILVNIIFWEGLVKIAFFSTTAILRGPGLQNVAISRPPQVRFTG